MNATRKQENLTVQYYLNCNKHKKIMTKNHVRLFIFFNF